MPSEQGRKRKTKVNPPRNKCASSSSSEPKSISPSQRVKEYPAEPFDVSSGKLFCYGCREEVNIKSTVINNHIHSKKHQIGKAKLEVREGQERDIADALLAHNEEEHLRGGMLPQTVQVYRVKVVMCFLHAGVPLSKIDCFRDLFEENRYRLTDRSHMFDYIPFILKEEKREFDGNDISVTFDGTHPSW